MKLDAFVKRPILSGVISALIVLVGILGALSLPMERYPDIAPPTVQVTTNFFGASAETLLKTVVKPLEDAIMGVENMSYMSSRMSNSGQVQIDVVFKQGTNPDMNTVNVQNRVQKAQSLLPQEVKSYGVTVEKTQNSLLQIFSLCSPTGEYDFNFLSNYSVINIKPKILLVNGIGKFNMLGSNYSMRIWLDPEAMAQHKLNPSDVSTAISNQHLESATGILGSDSDETYQYTMCYTGRFTDPKQFEDIVVRAEEDGSLLRLGDIAKIELGAEAYTFIGETNGQPGVMCMVYQSAGSNATLVNQQIDQVLDEVRKDLPSGIDIVPLMSTNDFLFAAIDQVIGTLRDAIILVILIVLIFLKDFRSTIIPFISIMVSLIGTFAFMSIAGFSINLLTLFALVLVIGTVVDDSIVVVEAVHANFGHGITSPFKATTEALSAVAMPVITSSLVFMAVFIPVSMMGGTSGVFYQQFGLTMAVAVGISALNALTLVPALSARMIHPLTKCQEGAKPTFQQRYSAWFDALFEKFGASYKRGLEKIMHAKWILWTVSFASLAGLVLILALSPSALVPMEDQGSFIIEVGAVPGTSINSSLVTSHAIADKLKDVPGIENVSATAGYGFIAGDCSSSSCVIIKLKHWDLRKDKETSMMGIYQKINAICSEFKQVDCTVFTLPMIPGYGSNGGIDMYVQDRRGGSVAELNQVTLDYIAHLNEVGISAFVPFNMDYPQWEVSVDAAKCERLGTNVKDVLSALAAYCGGSYIADINLYGKVWKVMMQADPNMRRDEYTLDRSYVRLSSGGMSPLSNFITLRRIYGAESLKSFNMFTAINLSVITPYTTGETLQMLQQYADKYLPEGYTIDFAGMSREEKNQGGLGGVLILCSFIIYLILAALYESLVIPFSIILTVPVGLVASFGLTSLMGIDNNIYVQTGVVMLIGLLSKTGILITEYAVDRHKEGLGVKEAAIEAAGERLRPILMTVMTMVFGMIPLVLSVGGVGGVGNFSLGSATIAGMVVGTIGLLYIVPVLYTTFQSIQDKIDSKGEKYDEE